MARRSFTQYRRSLPGTLLVAREATLAHIRPVLRTAGLTEPQWRVMRVIEAEGECEPTDAADLALIQLPSMTRIMRDLAARGLVERSPSPQSLRRSTLRLTPEGCALLDATSVDVTEALAPHVERFGKARLADLMSELRALSETLAGTERGPLKFS